MNKFLIVVLLAITTWPVMAQKKNKNQTVKMKDVEQPLLQNELDTASYAFGLSMARDLKKRGLTALNAQALSQAIDDFFSERALLIDEGQEQEAISSVLTAANEALKKEQTVAGDKFLADNKSRSGIEITESGLQYEIIRDAVGPKPAATEEVTVNYKGALIDGKVFDSSYDRGEPISFQLNRVIPGWQEGLQLMPVGSHYRFYIPYQLGYGERGAGNDIPPFSVLVFDVELLKIGGN